VKGKYCIDVGRQQDASLSGSRPIASIITAQTTEYIADRVDLNLLQPEFVKTFGQPLRAAALAERRRRDRYQLLLPLHHLAIMQVEPLERRMHAGQRSQLADAGKS
jgi:hypothetical protein